jgi:hypothetical protein
VVKHLHWVTHSLTAPQKAELVTRSKELLHQLLPIEHPRWQSILTLDESWSYFATDQEHIWLRPEEQPSERARHTIHDPIMMVAITWNPLEFHLPDTPPNA